MWKGEKPLVFLAASANVSIHQTIETKVYPHFLHHKPYTASGRALPAQKKCSHKSPVSSPRSTWGHTHALGTVLRVSWWL